MCPDCAASLKDWTWGGYHSTCSGCMVRLVASWPKHMRQKAYADALRRGDETAKEELRLAVLAEYRRIDELRGRG
jgi:hypothetical protein